MNDVRHLKERERERERERGHDKDEREEDMKRVSKKGCLNKA
jgi:hypothetical protein